MNHGRSGAARAFVRVAAVQVAVPVRSSGSPRRPYKISLAEPPSDDGRRIDWATIYVQSFERQRCVITIDKRTRAERRPGRSD